MLLSSNANIKNTNMTKITATKSREIVPLTEGCLVSVFTSV